MRIVRGWVPPTPTTVDDLGDWDKLRSAMNLGDFGRFISRNRVFQRPPSENAVVMIYNGLGKGITEGVLDEDCCFEIDRALDDGFDSLRITRIGIMRTCQ